MHACKIFDYFKKHTLEFETAHVKVLRTHFGTDARLDYCLHAQINVHNQLFILQ
jgi:hypothetical protein